MIELPSDCNVDIDAFLGLMETIRNVHQFVELETDLVFSMFDADGDQCLNRDEFKELSKFFTGYNPCAAALNEAWNSLDEHGDGIVTRQKYIQWLCGPNLQLNPIPPSTPKSSRSSPESRSPGPKATPFDAFLITKRAKDVPVNKPPWYPRHQISACDDSVSIHPSIRGYFSRMKSEWCTREGRERLLGVLPGTRNAHVFEDST